jgi:hypothetical protein
MLAAAARAGAAAAANATTAAPTPARTVFRRREIVWSSAAEHPFYKQ